MAYLVVRERGRAAFTVDLGDSCAVGRDRENDLAVEDRLVSRRHLRLARGPSGWTVSDLASRHGTYLNGARVGDAPLRDRDQLQAGNVIMMFHDGPSPALDAVFTVTQMSAPREGAEAGRLQLLFEISRAIGALGDPDELCGRLLEGIVELLHADHGAIHLVDRPGRPGRRVVRGPEVVLSQKLLDAILLRRETALVRGTPAGLGAPLLHAGRVAGFLFVSRRAEFTELDIDYLTVLAHLTAAAIEQSSEQQRLRQVAEALREAQPVIPMVGDSEPMRRLRAKLERYAPSDASVLIRGESGTGKELVARTLHALSPRAELPFVAVNCAAIPDSLIESELFGHEKGAFTGAVRRRRGKFAMAHHGTLFLDEVGDLSPSAQAKVLRAIEEGEIQPVGAELPVDVDVRIVSATHKPLEEDIAAGRFRADLFYRLDVADVEVPPLRERGDDVVLLARAFLERASERLGRRADGFAPGALDALRRHRWPGNVRELANEVERALLLADGPLVGFEDLRARLADDEGDGGSMAEVERRAIERALEESEGNIVAAARLLGISRATLYRKLGKYKLDDE